MDGEDQTISQAAEGQTSEKEARQRSTIAFPYMGMAEAIEVAEAIQNNVAGSQCDEVQLASWLNLSANSSGFRVRIATTKLFGLIESPSTSHYRLTPLGRDIVDPDKLASARVQAFLNVPLFNAFYDRWKGRQLPPAAAIERELVAMGVAEKQKDRARQTLERSAQRAGFFDAGRGRLVKPGLQTEQVENLVEDDVGGETNGGGGGGSGKGGGGQYHPFIEGLLSELPEKDKFAGWPVEEQAEWLIAAASIFKLLSKSKGRITIKAEEAKEIADQH